LLGEIPAHLRPHLPQNFHDRVLIIREWMNNDANQATLNAVQYLSLSHCHLLVMPPEISRLVNLTTLNLDHNQLAALPREIGQLVNLTTLCLQHNQLTTLPREIGQLVNLVELFLSYNQLTALPPEIGHLVNLAELFLNHNQLTSLPSEIGQIVHLTALSLDHNQLTALPLEIVQLVHLLLLSLDPKQLSRDVRSIMDIFRKRNPACYIGGINPPFVIGSHLGNNTLSKCNRIAVGTIVALSLAVISAYAFSKLFP
jgi:hypothetical protein